MQVRCPPSLVASGSLPAAGPDGTEHRRDLGGCPRTRKIIVFENLNLYKSIVYKQDFLKKVYSWTAS